MKALTREEVMSWCQQRSVRATSDGYLYFDGHERRCLAIELPEKPYQLVALANDLLPYTQGVSFRERSSGYASGESGTSWWRELDSKSWK